MLVTNKFFQTYFHNQVACLKPFNSCEWPRQNFSLLYLYNIMQTSDENKKNINYGITNWSDIKFSKLTWWESFNRQ